METLTNQSNITEKESSTILNGDINRWKIFLFPSTWEWLYIKITSECVLENEGQGPIFEEKHILSPEWSIVTTIYGKSRRKAQIHTWTQNTLSNPIWATSRLKVRKTGNSLVLVWFSLSNKKPRGLVWHLIFHEKDTSTSQRHNL